MVEENRCQGRDDLLDDIKRGSRLLEQQLLRFKYWIGDREIVSFIEMQQTKELQKVGGDRRNAASVVLKCLWLTVLSNLTELGLELGGLLLSSVKIQPSWGFRTWKRG